MVGIFIYSNQVVEKLYIYACIWADRRAKKVWYKQYTHNLSIKWKIQKYVKTEWNRTITDTCCKVFKVIKFIDSNSEMMISRDWCVRQMKSCYWRVVMLQSLMMNTVHKYSAKHYKWSQWYFTEHIIYVKKGYCIFITLNEVNWMKFLKKKRNVTESVDRRR